MTIAPLTPETPKPVSRVVESALSAAGRNEMLALEILAISLIDAEHKLALARARQSSGYVYRGRPSAWWPKAPPKPLDGSKDLGGVG